MFLTRLLVLASVGLPEKFPGIDGMVWDGNGNLVMTTSGRTVALSSRDNWVPAQIVFAVPQGPASTVARVGAALYAVHPHYCRPGSAHGGKSVCSQPVKTLSRKPHD